MSQASQAYYRPNVEATNWLLVFWRTFYYLLVRVFCFCYFMVWNRNYDGKYGGFNTVCYGLFSGHCADRGLLSNTQRCYVAELCPIRVHCDYCPCNGLHRVGAIIKRARLWTFGAWQRWMWICFVLKQSGEIRWNKNKCVQGKRSHSLYVGILWRHIKINSHVTQLLMSKTMRDFSNLVYGCSSHESGLTTTPMLILVRSAPLKLKAEIF